MNAPPSASAESNRYPAMIADEEKKSSVTCPSSLEHHADVHVGIGRPARWIRRDHKSDENRPEYKANILDLEKMPSKRTAAAKSIIVTVEERPSTSASQILILRVAAAANSSGRGPHADTQRCSRPWIGMVTTHPRMTPNTCPRKDGKGE